jgi:hypothetical protein
MPSVQIAGWKSGSGPPLPLTRLAGFLAKEAGMDSVEAEEALERLGKGKPVDVYFDLGEDAAAQSFLKKAEALGLRATLLSVSERWYGAPPRPWFVAYALGGAVILWFLWSISSALWPAGKAAVIRGVILLIFVLSLPFLYQFRRPRPRTFEEKQQQKNRELRVVAGAWALLLVMLSIAYEPWLGVPLLGLTLGGIGCAFLIRRMNRSS